VKAYSFDKQTPVFRGHVLSPVSRQKIVSCNGEKVVHILCGNRTLSETRTVVSLLSSCYLLRLLIHVELLSLFPFSLISYIPVSKTTLATVSLKTSWHFLSYTQCITYFSVLPRIRQQYCHNYQQKYTDVLPRLS